MSLARLRWKFIISHKVLLSAQMAVVVVNNENPSGSPDCQQHHLLQIPRAQASSLQALASSFLRAEPGAGVWE